MTAILFKLSMDAMMLGVAAILFARARVIWREGSHNYVNMIGPPRTWCTKTSPNQTAIVQRERPR